MGFFDLDCLTYDPELSTAHFRSYHIKDTPYVILRYSGGFSEITKAEPDMAIATRIDLVTNINSKGLHQVFCKPFSEVYSQLPNHIQEQFIFEMDLFLEL
tara:strand:- start:759 stop:1058 length:300 start_codon:yes stop_codon:yes gene_type:complete